MKTPKEYLLEKENGLVKVLGEKTFLEEKVYFTDEVINFIEEYASIQKTELLKNFGLKSEGTLFETKNNEKFTNIS